MTDFLVVDAPSAYNAILGRTTLNKIGVVISPSHLKLKFHTNGGVGEECEHQQTARDCYLMSLKGKGAWVHQVETQGEDDLHPQTPRSVEVGSAQECALDSNKKSENGTQLKPVDEVEQVDIGGGKTLNIGKAIQGEGARTTDRFLTRTEIGVRMNNRRHTRYSEIYSQAKVACQGRSKIGKTKEKEYQS